MIESTDPSELAQQDGEPESTGDAALDFLLNKAEPKPAEEEEQDDAVEQEEEEEEEQEVESEEDDDPEIDLGDIKLKRSELKAGYMKDADYRQKTAAAAEATRNAQAIEARARQEREFYANQVDATLQLAHKKLIGDQAYLAELAQSDPAEWVAQNAVVQQRAAEFQALLNHRQAIAQQAKAEQDSQQSEYVENERKALKEKLPEWKNPEVAKREQTGIAQFLIDNGYSQEDLAGLQDHRALLLVRMAWKAQEAEKARVSAKAKQVQKQPGQTLKPGAAKPNTQQDNQVDLLAKRAKKTHRPGDALAYLLAKG